jgi:phosphatidylinositol-3-phosphatase
VKTPGLVRHRGKRRLWRARWGYVALAVAGFALLVVPGCSRRPPQHRASDTQLRQAPCGTRHAPRAWKHVVWILMENRDYGTIVGRAHAPYLNSLVRECGVATSYYAVAHPSLPNYIALTSGGTQRIHDDGPPTKNARNVPTIFSQLQGNWRAYAESIPRPCSSTDSDDYAARHNPPVYYTALGSSCARNDLPLPRHPALASALTFIAPNLCHDMHSCSVLSGDRWLSTLVPKLLRTPQYRRGDTAVFVTWDEDEGKSMNRVPLLVIAPSVKPGTHVGQRFDHYSLLRTTEEMLRLGRLESAVKARSMRRSFGL